MFLGINSSIYDANLKKKEIFTKNVDYSENNKNLNKNLV